jgi:transcriptional accessory protein Tex/SPT6
VHNAKDTAYDTPEHVMKGAQRMAAQLLAAEPGIRQFVRREFNETAVVNTGAMLASLKQEPYA